MLRRGVMIVGCITLVLAACGLEQYDLALESYDKALEINPKDQLAINNRQNTLLKLKGN